MAAAGFFAEKAIAGTREVELLERHSRQAGDQVGESIARLYREQGALAAKISLALNENADLIVASDGAGILQQAFQDYERIKQLEQDIARLIAEQWEKAFGRPGRA